MRFFMTERSNSSADEIKKEVQVIRSFALLHLINDLHATTLANIIPMLEQTIHITLSQAGMLSAVFGVMHIFGQPISGYIADRQKKPLFAIVGPIISVAAMLLLPLSPKFAIAFLLCVLLGLGTAMFHPQGFGRTGYFSHGKAIAFNLALFSASGSIGSSIGPLYLVFFVSLLGKKLFPLMLIPAGLLILSTWRIIGHYGSYTPVTTEESIADFFRSIKNVLSKIYKICIVTAARDGVYVGIKTFLPLMLIKRGGSAASAGMLIFALSLSIVVLQLIGGKIASKVGNRKVMLCSMAASPIFLLSGVAVNHAFGFALLILGFGLLETCMPITTSMAQQKCTTSRSTASSIATGTAWGIANLAPYPIGIAADAVGLTPVLCVVAAVPWLIVFYIVSNKVE